MNSTEKIIRELRSIRGPTSAARLIKRAAGRLVRLLYVCQENELEEYDLRQPLPPSPKKADVVLREITAEDLGLLRSMVRPRVLNIFRKRLRYAVGVLALVCEEPAGYGWLTQNPLWPERKSALSYPVIPKPGCAYLFDLFVHPRFRRRGLAVLLIQRRLKLAVEAGAKTAFFTHSIRNRAMVQLARKIGFQSGGRMRFRRVLWKTRRDMNALWKFAQKQGGGPVRGLR